MQVIYIDTLFLLNCIVNYLILLATAKIGAVRQRRLRIGLGALLGGGYAVLAVFPQFAFLGAGVMKLVAGLFMVLVVFGGDRGLLRLAVIFFAVSAAFGGVIYAVSLVAGGGGAGSVYLPLSLKVLVLSFLLCYGVFSLVFARTGRDAGAALVEVALTHRGRTVRFTALVDTGNALSDPCTGGEVLVAERAAVLPLFSPPVQACLSAPGPFRPVELLQTLRGLPEGVGFYLIPYTAVGVESAFLLTFRPDSVCIDERERKGMAVALSPTCVGGGERYAALVNGGVTQ